jgi:hypothetical protein
VSVNATNNRTLVREYGYDSDDCVGKTIELMLGEAEYRGEMQPSIIVRPISPRIEKKPPKSDMNDDIPF